MIYQFRHFGVNKIIIRYGTRNY